MSKTAKRSLGQNFLIEPGIRKRLVEWAIPQDEKPVLEIGPGEGALTWNLKGAVRSLTVIEKDDELAAKWSQRVSEFEEAGTRLSVLHGDFLEWNGDLKGFGTVIGNLPFNVSIAIYQRVLEELSEQSRLYFMFQKEVAQRLMSRMGKDYGSLSVWSQLHGPIRRLAEIPPSAFRPRPKVSAWFLEQKVAYPKGWSRSTFDQLETLLRLSFAQRRRPVLKKLLGSFPKAKDFWERHQIPVGARVESIPPELWSKLVEHQGA